MEQAWAVAQMELMKLRGLCQRRLVQGRNVRNNYSRVLLRPTSAKLSLAAVRTSLKTSFPLGNAVSTRAATTSSGCVFSRSPPTAINPQPVTSKVDLVDAKPNLNVAAKNFVPKQRVFINRDETLSASRPYVIAQSRPEGPVPHGNVNTSMVQSNSIALETIKGLSTAIREGIALPKRNQPTFDGNPLHYYGFLKL